LNYILIPQYGALGAAIGTLVAEISVLIIQIIVMFKIRKSNYLQVDSIDLIKVILASSIASILIIIFANYINASSVFIRLCLSALIFGIGFIIACFITKEKILLSVFDIILKKIGYRSVH